MLQPCFLRTSSWSSKFMAPLYTHPRFGPTSFKFFIIGEKNWNCASIANWYSFLNIMEWCLLGIQSHSHVVVPSLYDMNCRAFSSRNVCRKRPRAKGIRTCRYEDKFGAICPAVFASFTVLRNDFLPFRFQRGRLPYSWHFLSKISYSILNFHEENGWGAGRGRGRQGIKMCWKSFGTHPHFSDKNFKQLKNLYSGAFKQVYELEVNMHRKLGLVRTKEKNHRPSRSIDVANTD